MPSLRACRPFAPSDPSCRTTNQHLESGISISENGPSPFYDARRFHQIPSIVADPFKPLSNDNTSFPTLAHLEHNPGCCHSQQFCPCHWGHWPRLESLDDATTSCSEPWMHHAKPLGQQHQPKIRGPALHKILLEPQSNPGLSAVLHDNFSLCSSATMTSPEP